MSPDPLPPVPPRRSALLSILLALLVFVGGAGVGSAVTLVAVGKRLEEAAQQPELMPGRMADRLERKLGLDPRQRRHVEQIIERHNTELIGMRRDAAQRMRTPLRAMADDVARELTPGQERRWREHVDEMVGRFWPGGLSSVAPRGGKGFGKPPHAGPRGKLRDKLRERLDERHGEPDVDG